MIESSSLFYYYIFEQNGRLNSFPTRRSSDLNAVFGATVNVPEHLVGALDFPVQVTYLADRKSTRLNSSHVTISYAVLCLKKKTRYVVYNEGNLSPVPNVSNEEEEQR